MAKKTSPEIVARIIDEWDSMNGGMSDREKAAMIAKKLKVVAGTVKKYVTRRVAGKVGADGKDVRSLMWPAGKPIPRTVQRVNPCPVCKRMYMEPYHQAVVIKTTNDGIAYLRCRCCKHSFKLAYGDR